MKSNKLLILGYLFWISLFSLFMYYMITHAFVELALFSTHKNQILHLYEFTIKDNFIILDQLNNVDVSSLYHQINIFFYKYLYSLEDNVSVLVYKYRLLTDAELQVIQELMEKERIAIVWKGRERLLEAITIRILIVLVAIIVPKIVF